MRRDRLGRRIGRNRWRIWITDEWRSADLVWLSRAEEFSNGHRTELEEFRILEPRPNLRDYMLSLSPAYQAGGCPIRVSPPCCLTPCWDFHCERR